MGPDRELRCCIRSVMNEDKSLPLPAFTIGRHSTRIDGVIADAREQFVRTGVLLVRGGVSDDLLAALDTLGQRATYVGQQVPQIGHRWVDSRELAATAMKVAVCRPAFLRWVEAVTGCGPTASMAAWVAETRPGGDDHLGWHRDTGANYAVGMTVHLGADSYEGGIFELREVATGIVRYRHDRAHRGDVLLFDIDQRLEHRVTPVTAGAPRRVFTGWLLKAD